MFIFPTIFKFHLSYLLILFNFCLFSQLFSSPTPTPQIFFFKTSIIVGWNRYHTFSFKSCPLWEKLGPSSNMSAIKIPHPKSLLFIFWLFLSSSKTCQPYPTLFFLSETRSHSYSRTYVVLVWELSLEIRETVRV